MFNSFFNKSARCGPTPFKYSIGLASMEDSVEIKISLFAKIAETTFVTGDELICELIFQVQRAHLPAKTAFM